MTKNEQKHIYRCILNVTNVKIYQLDNDFWLRIDRKDTVYLSTVTSNRLEVENDRKLIESLIK